MGKEYGKLPSRGYPAGKADESFNESGLFREPGVRGRRDIPVGSRIYRAPADVLPVQEGVKGTPFS